MSHGVGGGGVVEGEGLRLGVAPLNAKWRVKPELHLKPSGVNPPVS